MEPLSPRERIIAFVAIVLAAAGAFAAVVAGGVLPTNDGWAHLYNAHVLAHLDDPPGSAGAALGYARFLEENPTITSHGFVEVYRALEPLLGWRAAYRADLVVVALLSGFAVLALVLALDKRRWPLALVGFALAFNHSFYLGIFNFSIGMSLAFFAIALWVRDDERDRTPIEYALLALLVFVAALCHVVAAALGGLTAAAVSGARLLAPVPSSSPSSPSRGRRALVALAGLALAGAPALAVAALSRGAGGDAALLFEPLTARVTDVVQTAPGPAWRGIAMWALALAGAASVVAAWRERKPADRALAVLGLVFLAFPLLAPRDAGGWQLMSLRPLFAAAVFLIVVLEPKTELARLVAWGAAAVFAFASLASTAVLHRALAEVSEPFVDRVSSLRPAPALYGSIVTTVGASPEEAGLRHYREWQRAPQLAAMFTGGVAAYSYVSLPRLHPLRLTVAPPPSPPERTRWEIHPAEPEHDRELRRLAALNVPVGHLLAFGTGHELDVVEAAGWEATQRIDAPRADELGVMVARFEGCAARFHTATRVDVEEGFVPMKDAMAVVTAGGENGENDVVVRGLGCGPMWFRFKPLACREADVAGRIAVELRRDAVVDVTCTQP